MSRWLKGRPLSRVTSSEPFVRLHQEIRARHRAMEAFARPEDLWAFLDDRGLTGYDTKDALLRALILEYQRHPSPLLTEFLAARFVTGVTAICRQLREWTAAEPAEVASQAWLCFFETLRAYDVNRYPARVAGCLMGMTRNRLRSWLRGERREGLSRAGLRVIATGSDTRTSPDDGHKIPLAPPRNLRSFWDQAEALLGSRNTGDRRPDQATVCWAARLLSALVERGVFRESEKHVLMATCVAGRPVSQLVGHEEYQKVKKRRQRALARLKLLLREQAQARGASIAEVVAEILDDEE